MITATQCRMARSALKWDINKAAAAANVGHTTICHFETGKKDVREGTRCLLQRAFESAGVEFIDNGLRLPESEKE
jgi:hypothetical protein